MKTVGALLYLIATIAIAESMLVEVVSLPEADVALVSSPCSTGRPGVPGHWMVAGGVTATGRVYWACWEHAKDGGVTIHTFDPARAISVPRENVRYEVIDVIKRTSDGRRASA